MTDAETTLDDLFSGYEQILEGQQDGRVDSVFEVSLLSDAIHPVDEQLFSFCLMDLEVSIPQYVGDEPLPEPGLDGLPGTSVAHGTGVTLTRQQLVEIRDGIDQVLDTNWYEGRDS